MKHVLIYFPRHGNPYEAYENYEKHQENESKRIHVRIAIFLRKVNELLGKKKGGGGCGICGNSFKESISSKNVEELKDLLLLNHDHGIRGFV